MSFQNISYLPLVLLLVVIFILIIVLSERKYFSWIKLHWFYERSFTSKTSSFFYMFGFGLMLLALLDLRGPEKKIEGMVKDQKTIIMIDSSASMLAEDVRPNRFNKAILLARHFIKKAVGHQVSLIVFSDSYKQIVPFTKDINLIDAKLLALEKIQLSRGGTGLSMALQESIQLFKADGLSSDVGNILVFTDAEETAEMYGLNISEAVSVAIVGVGTLKGARIPIRDERGIFRGNKKFDGKEVISKLDEDFLKKLSGKIKNYSYWIASSYSLPTDQILKFFNEVYKVKTSKNNIQIRPVLAQYLLIPAVLLMSVSFILKFFKTFIIVMLAIFLFDNSISYAQEVPKKSDYIKNLELKYLEGKLDKEGRIHLADKLLQNGFPKEAQTIYDESLDSTITEKNKKSFFNQSAAQFQTDNIREGVKNSLKLMDYLESSNKKEDKELLEKLKKNLSKLVYHEEKKQQQKQKEKQDKEKNKDQKNQDQKNQQQSGEQKDDQSGEQKNKQDQSGKQDKQEEKESKETQGDKKEDKGKEKENKENPSNKKDGGEKDSEQMKKDAQKSEKGEQPSNEKDAQKKVPALLKQLMSDDNQLQKEFIDAQTRKRSRTNRKDW